MAAYQAFIETLISRLNAKCAEAFSHEQAHLQPLPTYRHADYETLTVRVSCHSTISVRCILYSVPSRLVGRQLTVHLYHDRLVGYVGSQGVVELPRLRVSTSAPSRRARCINYRHVIESLRRKPRAFLHCRWQQELLPNDHWRQLWQALGTQFDLESAGRLMVEALYLAATQDKETAVADYLEAQLQQQTLTLAGLQKHFQLLQPVAVPSLDGQQHPLLPYDQLLTGPDHAESQPEPKIQPDPQSSSGQSQPATPTPAIIADAPSLERSRAAGDSTPLVLRPVLDSTLRVGGGPSRAEPHQTGAE